MVTRRDLVIAAAASLATGAVFMAVRTSGSRGPDAPPPAPHSAPSVKSGGAATQSADSASMGAHTALPRRVVLSSAASPSVRPLSVQQLAVENPAAYNSVTEGLHYASPPGMKVVECLTSWRNRPEGFEGGLDWNLQLRIVSENGEAVVHAVDDDPEAPWPEIVDDELRSCIVDGFRGYEFPGARADYDVTIAWPMRIASAPPSDATTE